MGWHFWIDVGGTFTDCVARNPDGQLTTTKVLSSGRTKGRLQRWTGERSFQDAARRDDPDRFWIGYRLWLLNKAGERTRFGTVVGFDPDSGSLQVDDWHTHAGTTVGSEPLRSCHSYELDGSEEAPLLAIRRLLGLRRTDSIPPCELRLGTTRGTNALLERKGARVAFVTTCGFADVLRIANQDRPRLFDLAIQKPQPLYQQVIEVNERMAPDATVLQPVDLTDLRSQLAAAFQEGVESLAVALLHAWINPLHEQQVEQLAREVGFTEVSVSHRVSPRIKLVSRGDTTVLDAYLNPVLREYVQRLEQGLGPQSLLRLMTSSGGLVSAAGFTGRESILSGPAGGVIGFSQVAAQAGFRRAIGFDMGGTSTDVARFDGRYEYEYETLKAGVRVATPLLAIETVAAGGGSLCGFDGVQLFVGPESAGADPGPACYGRGGPLTVTDVNLALGRLLPDEFPFPLDGDTVTQRLQTLCDDIAVSPLGKRYSPIELAEGFIALANTNMTRAIRNISIARGYDPADAVLVTFGGAGGQHACAVAESLEMQTILAHPLAGVLSAYGIGRADVRRQSERPVLQPLSAATLAELQPVFEQLEQELTQQVVDEGIATVAIERPLRSLDLRYQGVEAMLSIPEPSTGDYAAAYESRHAEVYGYRHTNRPMEIVALRVEVVGCTPDSPDDTACEVPRQPIATAQQRLWRNGQFLTAGVFHRRDLHPGDRLVGPALLCGPTSTFVLDPGWTGRVTGRGDFLLTREVLPIPSTAKVERAATALDLVQLEVFNNQFASIAEQMGVTLQRTAISTNVKERLDFSCAIFDRQGNLVVNAPHIPVHLGAMGETVRSVLADNPDWQPGDVVVTNDPYRGGSHLPDVTVVTPVHDPATGELQFITASRAHHAEIGGIVPGSVPPFSRCLADEGVLIRNFRLIHCGETRVERLREQLLSGPFPSRRVEDNLADIAAQVAANQLGAKQLLELVGQHGFSMIDDGMSQIREAAALKMRRALTRHGDGVYIRSDALDDGTPIAVRITIADAAATIDFTGTGPVHPGNLNANRAIVTAAVMYVFRCLLDEDIPLNSGVLEPLTLILPPGLLNPPATDDPRDCPAVVGGNVETSQRIVDVLLGALGLAAASQGTMNNLTFGNDQFGYYETICGGSGATAGSAGADAVHTHMTNTRLTDAEVLEQRYPIRVREFRIRHESGGSGIRRGGDGVIRRLEFLEPLQVSMLSQRRGTRRPFGLMGGEPGQAGVNQVKRVDEEEWRDCGAAFHTAMQPGDQLEIRTPGGGGWGAPSLKRPGPT
ncbi:MAG: hydantoinase B/oxoprolinase family protein [Planctomycetaceae bacterium]